ncbi:hypothetical protein [Nitrosopumilus sp.]
MANKNPNNLRNSLVYILGITYVVCVAIIALVNHFTSLNTVEIENGQWLDIQNWVSMVVTLIIPLGVAIVFWKYSHFHQKESSDILKESTIRRNKKRDIIFPRIALHLDLTKQYLDEKNFELANQRFVQAISMIFAFEESLDSDELNNLVEVLEVGKVFSENKGYFPMLSQGVFPSVFTSIPANIATFSPQLESQILYFSNPPKKLEMCYCGNELPCDIHANQPSKKLD